MPANRDQEFYIGGEPVLDPFSGAWLTYSASDPVIDLYQSGVPVVLKDPFGNTLYHQAGDKQLHRAGDPVYHLNGDVQTFLGGELTFDENGHQVFNEPGHTPFLHGAGQAEIQNRLTVVYDLVDKTGVTVPEGTITFANGSKTYEPVSFTFAALTSGLSWNLQVDGFTYNLGSSDQLGITVYDGTRIFNLVQGVDFTVSGNVITLSHAVVTYGPVTLKVTIATPSVHQAGDAKVYFGTVQSGDAIPIVVSTLIGRSPYLLIGDPVVDVSGNLVLDANTGLVKLYTAETIGNNLVESFTFLKTGSLTQTFTLKQAPNGFIKVVVDGKELTTSQYTVNGLTVTVTLTTRPATDVRVDITYRKTGTDAIKLHGRGETVYVMQSGAWVPDTYAAGAVRYYVGKEAKLYRGGEASYYTLADPIQDPLTFSRITMTGATGGFGTDTHGSDGSALYIGLDNVNVTMGTGIDTVIVSATHTGTTSITTGANNDVIAVRATSGNTNIQTGNGNDVLAVGSQGGVWQADPRYDSPVFSNQNGWLNQLHGILQLDAGAGTDSFLVDDTGDTNANANVGTLTSSSLVGLGADHIDYLNVESVSVNLGAGDDTLTVASTITGPTRIEGRAGNDTINILTISGPTTVYGDAAPDTQLTFGRYTITPIVSGNDAIRVGSTSVGDVNGSLNHIDKMLTIDAGGGTSDSLYLNDLSETARNFGVLTRNRILRLGMGGADELTLGIDYENFEFLQIDLGSGGDIFTVQSTHDGTTTINSGNGDDVVDVQATAPGSQTSVNTGSGADVVNIGSAAGLVATADLTGPSNGGHIGLTELNSRGYIDVSFRSYGANSIDPNTLDGGWVSGGQGEVKVSGAAAAGVTLAQARPIQLVRLPDGTLVTPDVAALLGLSGLAEATSVYRYAFTGTFVPGAVTVEFVAGSWADRAGQLGLGGLEHFTVEIPTFALANPPPTDASALNAQGYLDVTYTVTTGTATTPNTVGNEPVIDFFPQQPQDTFTLSRIPVGPIQIKIGTDAYRTVLASEIFGNQVILLDPVDAPVWLSYVSFSVNGDELALSGPGSVQFNGSATFLSGTATTATFRYGVTGQFVGGTYTVTALAGKWQDSKGNLGTAGSASFTVEVPVAHIATPGDGQSIDVDTLNTRGYLDVVATPTSDNTLTNGLLTDSGAEFTLTGPSGVTVHGDATLVSGHFHYAFDGLFAPGEYTVTWIAGSFGDSGGSLNLAATERFRVTATATATVGVSLAGLVADGAVGVTVLNTAGGVDLTFTPASGATVVDGSITASDVAISGVTVTGVTRVSGNTFHFATSAFLVGVHTVTIAAGAWSDSAGSSTPATTLSFVVELPTAQLDSPSAGSSLGLNQLGNLDIEVTFTPTTGESVDASHDHGGPRGDHARHDRRRELGLARRHEQHVELPLLDRLVHPGRRDPDRRGRLA